MIALLITDLLISIAIELDFKDIIHLSLTNKDMKKKIIDNDLFWKRKRERDYMYSNCHFYLSWKLTYKLTKTLYEIEKLQKKIRKNAIF
jgi:hypothetical protein